MPDPHSAGSLFVTRPSLRSLRLIQTKEPPPSPGKETPAFYLLSGVRQPLTDGTVDLFVLLISLLAF